MLDIEGGAGGRIFFSGASRSLVEEDEIRLTSVGVDIGSSTAHLMFSRITLERLDTRYVVADREVLYASDILLTPYTADGDIDTDVLAEFIDREYAKSGVSRDQVDSGALILTGVAVRRRNARAIGDLFAAEAGKFVSVSAGDSLETVMAANGSGAVAASSGGRTILNIDVGGGTTKLAVCRGDEVLHTTAVEAGARLVVTDAHGRITRLEDFGGRMLGKGIGLGDRLSLEAKQELAATMAGRIMEAARGALADDWRRLPQLPAGIAFDGVIVSGGVSAFMDGATDLDFGDLGPFLAQSLKKGLDEAGLTVLPAKDGIRATVVGASQYTVQVSGSTVYLDPIETLPLRNVATIRPQLDLEGEIDADAVADEIRADLQRFDLGHGEAPVAIALPWSGSATYARLDRLSRGLTQGMAEVLDAGHPLTIVMDGDVGGLLGMHCRENGLTGNAIVSIDGITLSAFDFIDVGEVIAATGSVPVVVKSLVFPGTTTAQKEGNGNG